ncbi:hypothetical protein Hanom_Chr12g01169021 [Helianthus anomalus]
MPCRPLGAYCWNLLSGKLEWSWVEIQGNTTQEKWLLHVVYKYLTNGLCFRCIL